MRCNRWPGFWPLRRSRANVTVARAVELAERANKLTGSNNVIVLHTLAAVVCRSRAVR